MTAISYPEQGESKSDTHFSSESAKKEQSRREKKGKSAIDFALMIKALFNGDELSVIDLGVEAAFCKPFLMGPLLEDIAVIDDEDDVGVADGGKAVAHFWDLTPQFGGESQS